MILLQSLKLPDYRLVIVAKTQKAFPYNYREHVQGWLYHQCLMDTEIGEKMHNLPYPNYNFALIPQFPKDTKNGLSSNTGYWMLFVSSVYQEFLKQVEYWIFANNQATWGNVTVEFKGLYHQPITEQTQFIVQPIVVLSKDKSRFVTPEETIFAEAICKGISNRYYSHTGKIHQKFWFKFLGTPHKKLIQYKQRNLISFGGNVRLGGSPVMIKFAQMVGLGQKPGAGMGMLT